MITNDEKIEIIVNKLNNNEAIMKSYIEYAEMLKDKYNLDDVLADCNAVKEVLLRELETLGAVWISP